VPAEGTRPLRVREVVVSADGTRAGARPAAAAALHTFPGPAGTFRQGTELTVHQKAILTALGLPDPPRGLTATPADQRFLIA
jgi:hypothetical protein